MNTNINTGTGINEVVNLKQKPLAKAVSQALGTTNNKLTGILSEKAGSVFDKAMAILEHARIEMELAKIFKKGESLPRLGINSVPNNKNVVFLAGYNEANPKANVNAPSIPRRVLGGVVVANDNNYALVA